MKRTEVLKRLIDDTGMSVKAFAEKAGLPYSTLRSMLERGIGNASVDNVIKACKALGIKVEQLEEMASNEITQKQNEDILTRAAHKVGHEGPLSDEEKDAIELAIRIALAKHKR